MLLPGSSKKIIAGFSLLEVLITGAIITIITVIALVQYGSFNSAVLLRNQAFEVALAIREAQTLAVSVRGEGNEFREEYGIFFSTALTEKNRYRLWQDSGSAVPAVYNSAPTDEQLGDFQIIDSRFELSQICYDDRDSCDATEASISFARPNFDAATYIHGGVGEVSSIELVFANALDATASSSVIISATGQITVR